MTADVNATEAQSLHEPAEFHDSQDLDTPLVADTYDAPKPSHTRSGSSLSSFRQNPSGVTHSDPLQLSGTPEIDNPVNVGRLSVLTGSREGSILSQAPPARSPTRRVDLQLSIKPPSPQPWDLESPPNNDNMETNGPAQAVGYSSAGSQRFGNMQSASGNARPLIPKSTYYFGPPAPDSAYGTPPAGQIGVHHPREILRIERDYTGGEVIQFAPIYPLELENRLTPTQFLESMNTINETLISAHSLRRSFVDNLTIVMTLQLSRLLVSTHFDKEMKRLRAVIDDLNTMVFNPVGLNVLWPGDVAFLYLEIEYY